MVKQSKFAKFKLVIILAYMSALAPLSTDMYLPALAKVKASFATSEFFHRFCARTARLWTAKR